MPFFKKKPVVIEARQIGNDYDEDLTTLAWCGGRWVEPLEMSPTAQFIIDTLEGPMTANSGDFIIKGLAGEFYPCKPEIFAESYEPVNA